MPESLPSQYPIDVLNGNSRVDVINTSDAHTLDELFRERVRRSPDSIAYHQFNTASDVWEAMTWAELALQVERWQVAFREQGLDKGDRVAICYPNSIQWVVFDQAALRLGLVVVPLYTDDRPDNMAYVIADSGACLLLLEDAALWKDISSANEDLRCVKTVLTDAGAEAEFAAQSVIQVSAWLPKYGQHLERGCAAPDDLASIVYTSGTTGRPKGVMLSHKNILSNAHAGLRSVAVEPSDHLLSFLPLSHMLERTVGYYGAIMAGAVVSFNRSIPELALDLQEVKPTILISVPRIFERIHNQIYQKVANGSRFKQWLLELATNVGWAKFEYQQKRASWQASLLLAPLLDKFVARGIRQHFGGELKLAIVGGAPLSLRVSKTFISLGLPLLQGYGLTETSPTVSVNTLAVNRPDTIGQPLRGVRIHIAEDDELWVAGENNMLGYWGSTKATEEAFDGEWLKTGDRALIDNDGFIRIIGRIKDILVMVNGEKVPPLDIEAAILNDHLFDQVMILGEGKSYLSALVVFNPNAWRDIADFRQWDRGDCNHDLVHALVLQRIADKLHDFPGYANVRRVHICGSEWTIENGLLTPTLKIKRLKITEHYSAEIDEMYAGHDIH